MIWHPVILAVVVTDLTAAFLLTTTAVVSFQVLLNWRPADSDRYQLRLETRCEAASLTGRWAGILFVFSTVLFLFGICIILPDIVPGAMCGTGVVQASQGIGNTAVLLRLLTLGLWGLWFELDKINRSHPYGPLTTGSARTALVAYPLFCLAVWATCRFAFHLETQQPVDCCTVVYDQFTDTRQATEVAGIRDPFWVGAFVGLSLLLGLLGGAMARKRPAPQRRGFRILLAASALAWAPVTATATVRVLSAYHFEVLHHHCPWCLFLPEHHLVGFAMLAAYGLVLFEALLIVVMPAATGPHPELTDSVDRRLRRSGWRIVASLLVFPALTLGPALWWRLLHGVWMSG